METPSIPRLVSFVSPQFGAACGLLLLSEHSNDGRTGQIFGGFCFRFSKVEPAAKRQEN